MPILNFLIVLFTHSLIVLFMFIHFSTDQIFIDAWAENVLIPFEDIERNFPNILHKLYKKYQPSTITVINWPGSFTQLRVACIALNILNDSLGHKIEFIDISKIDLYRAAMSIWLLPDIGLVFMWQRKKLRCMQKDTSEMKIVDQENVHLCLHGEIYFVDRLIEDHPVIDDVDPALHITNFSLAEWAINFEYKSKMCCLNIDSIPHEMTYLLSPRYMMEPQIG